MQLSSSYYRLPVLYLTARPENEPWQICKDDVQQLCMITWSNAMYIVLQPFLCCIGWKKVTKIYIWYIFITLSLPIALQSGCCSHTVSLRPDNIFSCSAAEFGSWPASCRIISRNWGLFGITQSPEPPKIVLTLRPLKVEIIFEVWDNFWVLNGLLYFRVLGPVWHLEIVPESKNNFNFERPQSWNSFWQFWGLCGSPKFL